MEKKSKIRPVLDRIPPQEERKILSSDIIANNRSFVGRTSRMTDGQIHAYEKCMPVYGRFYDKLLPLVSDEEREQYEEIVLDIGFGMGDSLIEMARSHPNTLFVGVETYKPGIGALFVRVQKLNLTNIRVFHGDAVPIVFHMCAEASLDRIQIFFPDPWQKARYHKRRLIQPRFLQLSHHLLKDGGLLWIVTDWEDYAIEISNLLQQFSEVQTESWIFAEEREREKELENTRFQSKFEKKGLVKGHCIYPFVRVKYG